MDAELVDTSLNETKNSLIDSRQLAHSGAVTCLTVELTSSQQVLVSGGRDGSVKVWSVFNNQLLCTLTGHQQSVCLSVCLSPRAHIDVIDTSLAHHAAACLHV